MQCIVVTPESTLRDTPADFVALALFDGEIGIAPGHTPMIGRIGCGEMRIRCEGKVDRYYVEGGFVEVAGDVVSILTGRVICADKIDQGVALEQLRTAAARKAHTVETAALRDQAMAQSRAQLRVAQHDKEKKL